MVVAINWRLKVGRIIFLKNFTVFGKNTTKILTD